MRKRLALALVGLVALAAFAACNNEGSPAVDVPTTTSTTAATTTSGH